MSIAVLFSGQGAQYTGMGKSLYENNHISRKIFDTAGEDVKELCFTGSAQQLARTDITQKCIYTMSMAAYCAFEELCKNNNIKIDMLAGFSLGEYSALTAAGVFSFEEGLKIVTNRGNWMHEAGYGKGSMCAVLGSLEKLKAVIDSVKDKGLIEAVNYNCPGQTVVAGENDAIAAFLQAAAEQGLRVIPLKVGGPFHSSLMRDVYDKLKGMLGAMELHPPRIPVYSNVTSKPFGKDLVETIAKQVMSPVLWERSIRNMINAGADTFIEIGPGKTLGGMLKRIDSSVTALNIEDTDSLNAAVKALKER